MSVTYLRLTIRDGDANTDTDVEAAVDPGSSVSALIDALPVPVDGRACYVGQVPLNPKGTVADSPLIAGAVLSIGRPGPVTRTVAGQEAGVLRVVGGPDAGRTIPLPPGRHRIARDSTAPVGLRDLDVSRREHAWLEVAPDGRAVVTDAGSTNGTFVDGHRVGTAPLTPGSVLAVGADHLQWTPAMTGALRAARATDGRVDFDRAYSPVPEVPHLELTMPAQKQTGPSNQLAAGVTAGLTVVAAIVAAIVFKSPMILLFSAVGVIGFAVARLVERSQRRQRAEEYAAARAQTEAQLQAHLAAEWSVRAQLAPGPAEVAAMIAGDRADLWARRIDNPHGLTLRVGAGDQPAAVVVRGEPWPGFVPPVLSGAPAALDLRATGVLGVVGADRDVHDVVRSLLVQLVALRGPDDLRLVVLAADGHDALAWTRWLPHADAGASAAMPCWVGNTRDTRAARIEELLTLLASRQSGSGGGRRYEDEVLLVLDGASTLRELPGMDVILRDGPAAGIYVICADRRAMNECRGLCELGPHGLRLTRTVGEPPIDVVPDRVDLATAERFARALSPMRDRITFARAQHAMPRRVRFLDLLQLTTPTAEDVLRQWDAASGPVTRVVLGADASGPVYVDLARQGPHTMLGGATGAGKSILMQTLVTSLLLANRPDALNLVLVDFKGGSAFLPFERCPHVVALIRSTGETAADVFDAAAAARVLASVRAEVNRRESALARYNGEIDDYWRQRQTDPTLPPLPRLVMVFDEFARVLETSPEFLKELVNVAAKGRSLGMHLVLGTQSLQGKLSPELKNNISLRISLRQNEPADSSEVLGVPDAAAIPGPLRGRGLIVCTTDERRTPEPFQSGYLGDPPPLAGSAPVSVRRVEWTGLGAPRPVTAGPSSAGPTDQDLTIAAIEQASERIDGRAPSRPLLPPLPARLTLADLPGRGTAPVPASALPFGLADEPERQEQPLEVLDLAGLERLMVAGGPQSGRTTFARTLITSLVQRFAPDDAHLYLVEQYRGGLADYADLPHCGGVFTPAEPDRVRRFVTWLEAETRRRALSAYDGAGTQPRIVVLVDGWEYFENHDNPALAESSLVVKLREVIATGAPLGVHVVALGGSDMLSHKLPTYYGHRLLLPFPKEETRRAHLNSRMTSPAPLPGRAIDAGSGRHVQLAEPGVSAAELLAAVTPVADPARAPRRFPAIPARVSLDELASAGGTTWLPVGIGGPEAEPVGVDLFAGAHALLVSGPAGSGRTTAAAVVARGLRRAGIGVLALAPPRSPLPQLLPQEDGVRVITGVSLKDEQLREAVVDFGDNPYAIVVDDANQLTVVAAKQGFGEAPTLLEETAQFTARGRAALVLTADATPILTGFPSPISRVLNSVVTNGSTLLLTPNSRAAALAHHAALEPDQLFAGPPGRGYLLGGPDPTLLQVATV